MTSGSGPTVAELARALLSHAVDSEQVEVCVARVRRTEVRAHGGQVESFTEAVSHGVGVRVVVGGRVGTSSCGSFAPDMVAGLLADARDNAEFASVDDRAGIAAPDGHPVSAFAGSDTGFGSITTDNKIDLALDVERRIVSSDPRVRGVRAAIYRDHQAERAVVTNTGVDAELSSSGAALSASVLIDDTDGGTRTGFAAEAGFGPSELDSDRVADLSVERGLQLLGAVRVESDRLPVVLPPRVSSSILGLVGSMLSGERVAKGRTPFSDRLGSRVAAAGLTLCDDPTDHRSVGRSEVDGEGLACRRVPLIGGGELVGYLHDSKSARASDSASTGSAIRSARSSPVPGFRSLRVAPGSGDLNALISEVDDGLLVLTLQGLHSGVNQVSGDFSAGVEGIRIRNGVLAEPIREATVAGSIPRMLLDIERIADDLEYLPSGALMPSIVIGGMSIGGVPSSTAQ